MGDTQGPLGIAGDRADPHAAGRGRPVVNFSIMALDSGQVHRFLRSVAIAKEQDRRLQMRWQPYNDSVVITTIYTILFWKGKPGWMEADIGDPKQVENAVNKDTDDLLKLFVTKAAAGPKELKSFLEGQARIRATCLVNIREKFAEVNSINAEVRRDTAEGVAALAKIKLGSDLFLLGLGLIPGAGTVIGLGYNVITGIVSTWDKAESAQVIAMSKPVGFEAGKKAAERIGETADKKILEGEGFGQRAERLGKLIEKYEKDSIGKQTRKTAKLTTRIRLRAGEMAAAEKAAQRSARSAAARKALGKLNYLFIAYSVYESWHEYRETLESVEGDLADKGE